MHATNKTTHYIEPHVSPLPSEIPPKSPVTSLAISLLTELPLSFGHHIMSVGDIAREPASEQTPLLRDSPNGDGSENTPLPQEPSTKELIWILGSIWLGVFLAALGMHSNSSRRIKITNFSYSCRYNDRRHALRPHFFVLQLILAAFVASHFVSDLQCCLPASQWPIDRYLLSSLGTCVLQRFLRPWKLDLWPGKSAMGYHPWSRRGGCRRRRSYCDLDLRHFGLGSSP